MTDDTLGLSTGKYKYDKKDFSNMKSKINMLLCCINSLSFKSKYNNLI